MVYNFEKIIIECLAKKYGVDIDKNLNEQVFNSRTRKDEIVQIGQLRDIYCVEIFGQC